MHLLSYPYINWHIFFVIIPTILLWLFQGKYLWKYKKTILYATVVALVYGIPADLLASSYLKLWYSRPDTTFGGFYFGLPLGEYFYILFAPQLAVGITLLLRKKLYAK